MVEAANNIQERNKSVRKAVCDSIKNYIIENNIEPGSRLPSELELADMLNVSRTSLREGIRMLEGSGFITTKHGGGMYVAEYDGSMLLDYIQYGISFGKDDIRDLYEVRKSLELNFICEAAERITDDQIQRLKEITNKMADCELLESHWHDRDFHITLFENISNRLAAHIIQLYWDIILCRWLPDETVTTPEMIVENHRLIIRALESHNPEFVQASMRIHMYDSHII